MMAPNEKGKGRQEDKMPKVPWTVQALAPPGRRGGSGPSMHTLAVLRRTNCFSLRQISCKSRLRRQHCPGPPGRRDGRQADGARGRGEGGGGDGEWSVCTRGALEQDGGGRRGGGGGGGWGRSHENGEKWWERKKLQHFKSASLSPSSSLLIHSPGWVPPNLLHPYPQKPLCCSAPPTLHPSSPLFYQLSDLYSAPMLAPPFSLTLPPSPSLYRKVEERWNSTKREKNQ